MEKLVTSDHMKTKSKKSNLKVRTDWDKKKKIDINFYLWMALLANWKLKKHYHRKMQTQVHTAASGTEFNLVCGYVYLSALFPITPTLTSFFN